MIFFLVSVNGRLRSCIKHRSWTARWNLSQRQMLVSGISEKCRLSDDESLSGCGRQGKCEKYHGLLSVENGLYVEVEGG